LLIEALDKREQVLDILQNLDILCLMGLKYFGLSFMQEGAIETNLRKIKVICHHTEHMLAKADVYEAVVCYND
jgi:hypothetical protein